LALLGGLVSEQPSLFLFLSLSLYLLDWSLNSGLHTCKKALSHLSYTSSHFLLVISDMESHELPGQASNCDPPIPSLPGSWDYRRGISASGFVSILLLREYSSERKTKTKTKTNCHNSNKIKTN
jgi:hypothetical protein